MNLVNNHSHCYRAVHMLYVATHEGLIKKISVLSRTQTTCVLEVWRPFPVGETVPILTLQYLKETVSIYHLKITKSCSNFSILTEG